MLETNKVKGNNAKKINGHVCTSMRLYIITQVLNASMLTLQLLDSEKVPNFICQFKRNQ